MSVRRRFHCHLIVFKRDARGFSRRLYAGVRSFLSEERIMTAGREACTERNRCQSAGSTQGKVSGGCSCLVVSLRCKKTPVADIATNDMNKRATRQQRSASVRIVRGAGQKSPTGRRRAKEADRAAIERGEDEGMIVAPN